MLGQTSLPKENAALTLQVDRGQAAAPQNAGFNGGTRFLWTGVGFALLMLIGGSACVFLPFASHQQQHVLIGTFSVCAAACVKPTRIVSEAAFAPSMPVLHPRIGRSIAKKLRPPALPGMKTLERQRPNSVQHMVVSPFDPESGTKGAADSGGPLPMTEENIEMVLEEMRPYLMADGGNVKIHEIDGPVVYLELQGACGTCPSSAMTLRMGLERGLKERIPEIAQVEQIRFDGVPLTKEGLEAVLETVRPFLSVTGGNVELVGLTDGLQPKAVVKITGGAASLNSVKGEIAERMRREFPTLHAVAWALSDDPADLETAGW